MGTSDGAYSLYADYSAAANSPVNSSPPTITGSPTQDQTLTAGPGTWSGNPTFAYQWLRCDSAGGNCTTIAGAATTTYLIQAGDVDATIRVRVTATNSNGQNVATSDKTGLIQPAAPPPNGVLGRASVGALSAKGTVNSLDASGPYTLAASSDRQQADRLPERRQLEHEDSAPSSTRTIAIPASPYGAESVFRATASASPARSPSPPAPRRAGSTSPSRARSPSHPASTGSATGTATKRPTPTTTPSPAASATPPPTTPQNGNPPKPTTAPPKAPPTPTPSTQATRARAARSAACRSTAALRRSRVLPPRVRRWRLVLVCGVVARCLRFSGCVATARAVAARVSAVRRRGRMSSRRPMSVGLCACR